MPAAERTCKICQTRRPKRFCPGVDGDICAICCGTEREVSVHCPLECPYLQEARKREPVRELNPKQFPNSDVQVTEEFLREHEPLLLMIATSIARHALSEPNVYDRDVREALDGLARTYRTMQSGLVYQSRPESTIAGRLYGKVQESIDEVQRHMAQRGASLRDAELLGIFVFLQHMAIQYDNERPKGRAFLDFLRHFMPPEHPTPSGSLIQTP